MRKSLVVISLSLLVLIFMNSYSMPLVTKNLNSQFFSQSDKRLLDLRYQGYQKHDVMLFFELIGPQGRMDYQTFQIPIDMIYPLLFAIGYLLFYIFYFQSQHCPIRVKKYQIYIAFLPIISAILDWSENINTYFLLQKFPSISEQSVSLGSHLTQFKFFFITISVFIFTAMIIHVLALRLKQTQI